MKTLSDKEFVCDKSFAGYDNTIVFRKKDVKEFIKKMDKWCEDIGRTTLITAETFMEVLNDKAGDKLK